jgi:hypothetical protein
MKELRISCSRNVYFNHPSVEGGYETSTAALRGVEDDEKRTWCLGIKLGHPVTGEHKYRDLVLQLEVGGKANDHAPQKKKQTNILFQNPKK